VPDLVFTYPWLLLGLLTLPLLVWLIRLTPPPPQRLSFPAAWLIATLRPTEAETAKSPWWLLLLRVLLAATLITAAARPIINSTGPLAGNGPLLLVVDNGWAAATNWSARKTLMADLLSRAEQAGQPAALLATALKSSEPTDFRRAAEVAKTASALMPQPWPAARNEALRLWAEKAPTAPKETPRVIWLSNGIAGDDDGGFIDALRRIGPLTIVEPYPSNQAIILGDMMEEQESIEVTVRRMGGGAEVSIAVIAQDELGGALARTAASFEANEQETTVSFALPIEHRNRLARISINDPRSAAQVILFDDQAKRYAVGLVEQNETTGQASRPLLGRHYYLNRALSPSAEVSNGTIEALLSRDKAVIILADPPALPRSDENKLAQWIETGGMTIRFAGPNLSRAQGTLLPVTLRRGNRAMGGALSWRDPPGIAPFVQNSPFFGLEVPSEVKISKQVLADPNRMEDANVWARLVDGTPLITASRLGKGWLVLIHVTSTADWSNLPLSGLFVDILDRLVRFSKGSAQAEPEGRLVAERFLTADGQLAPSSAEVRTIEADAWSEAIASASHPPGFYKGPSGTYALNLQDAIGTYQPLDAPFEISKTGYDVAPEKDVSGWLWGLALLLLALDGFVSLKARGNLGKAAAPIIVVLLAFLPLETKANDLFAIEATKETRLAYVVTGDPGIDEISRNGLATLTRILTARSAAELGPPMALNPELHDPVFFPLLYWPITGSQVALSDKARNRINRYLENGGTILFDQLDGGAAILERMSDWLRLPPMSEIRENHVLTRTFYLINQFPGRWTGSPLWIAEGEHGRGDGVAPALVGSHDWAAAWATDENQRPLFAVAPGGQRQRERAYRFGINLVIYVLTGNYKRDQVHLPAIMERLQR